MGILTGVITRLRYAVPVAAVAGLLLAAAFEPMALQARFPLTAPLCVAALFLTTAGLRVRVAWIPGLIFGAMFCYPLMWWMQQVGTEALAGMAGVETLFFALLGAVNPILARLPWWPGWLAIAYAAVEFWRSGWPFGGMPWGRLSFATADTIFAPGLPWLGTTGVGLVMALGGALLAWCWVAVRSRNAARTAGTSPTWEGGRGPAIRAPQRRTILLVAVAYLATVLLPILVAYPVSEDGTAVVAVVQGDVPGDGSDILVDHRQVTRNHADATVELAARVDAGTVPAPDFVLWPENSTAVDPFLDVEDRGQIERAVAAIDRPILVGGIVDAGNGNGGTQEANSLNQGIVWNPETGPADRYTKWHPVPFAEYLPWRDTVFPSDLGQLSLIVRDQLRGTRAAPLRIGDLDVADAMCFDIAYDDGIFAQLREGAELLTVQTSNVTYIHTSQLDQQFEITRVRALETGRSIPVASPNGISGVIAPDGSVIAVAERRTQQVLVEEVPLSTTLTPAVRMGAWPGRVLLTLSAVGVLAGVLLRRRARRPSAGRSGVRQADRPASEGAGSTRRSQ